LPDRFLTVRPGDGPGFRNRDGDHTPDDRLHGASLHPRRRR
jgi:hypothetical protein